MSTQEKPSSLFVVFAAINASLGLMMIGYSISIFNSLQTILQDYIFPEASTEAISFIASSPYLGGVFTALLTEPLSRKLGRRPTMIFASVISLIGVFMTLFQNLTLHMIGRLLLGFEGGIATVIVDIYITEITKEPLRSQLGCLPNIATSAGVVLAFLLGLFTPTFIERGITDIEYMMLLFVPGLLLIIKILNLLFLFKFETPFYLVSVNKEDEAKEVIKFLFEDEHEEKLSQLRKERDYIFQGEGVPIRELFGPKYRKALFIAGVAASAPYLMGITAPVSFSNMIFSEGLSPSDSNIAVVLTTLIGFLNLTASLLSMPVLKHYQRRSVSLNGCLLISCINVTITALCFMGLVGHFAVKILIMALAFTQYITIVTLTFLYLAESLPEIGVAILSAFGLAFGFIMTQIFLPLQIQIGYQGVFLMFSCLSVAITVILYFNMVETKGKAKLDVLKQYRGEKEEEENDSLWKKE